MTNDEPGHSSSDILHLVILFSARADNYFMPSSAAAVALSPRPAYDATASGDGRLLTLVSPPRSSSRAMKNKQQFAAFFANALNLYDHAEAEAILVLVETPIDWDDLRPHLERARLVIAADKAENLQGAEEMGLGTILLDMGEVPVLEKLTQALLNGVALDVLNPGADVVAVYSGFDSEQIDSLSLIRLDEHLGRLTSRDLRQLSTVVPLETLKTVVDLAIEIGREGREGNQVGTMFVVGDTRRVLQHCHPAGFDPVKGYAKTERDLFDPKVREAVKEIAILDGAFVISTEGIVEKAAQLLDAAAVDVVLSGGLGARHWAGAAISKNTAAIAVVVSQSNGTVRIFQDGEVVLRIEPFRRAMKWKEFEYEPPQADGE
jgi:DNA integrity scanning protein DisA with diadenylate cyclase activity